MRDLNSIFLPTKKAFRLLWGEAPPDSLKGKRGKEIEDFIKNAQIDTIKKVLLDIETTMRFKASGSGNWRRVLIEKISQIESSLKKI